MTFRIVQKSALQPIADTADQTMVAMRDGVRLATDIYLPSGSQRSPAVLVRTPYDKTSRYTGLKHQAQFYTDRGYVFVVQDVRGKFRSEGATVPYAFDLEDGYDTVDWIVAQSWSDGAVGAMGASYYGFTAWAAVASGHPAIRAAIPQVTGVDMADGHVSSRVDQEVPLLYGLDDLLQIWTNEHDYLAEIDYSGFDIARVVDAAEALIGPSTATRELLARASRGDWYSPYGARHPYHTTNIPVLHWINWFDPGLAPKGMTDWRHFRSITSRRSLHYLRAESSDHGGYRLEDVGKGDAANPYLNDEALQASLTAECGDAIDFFDEHLKLIRRPTPRPRARWHLGHVGWRETDDWEPAAQAMHLFLATAGSGVGVLASGRAPVASDISWAHDPGNPVPSTVSNEALWYVLAAYPDERDLAHRDDVLAFRTETLTAPVAMAGQATVRASITTSGPSAHVFFRLQDVHPDGTTRAISYGRVRIDSRHSDGVIVRLDDIAYQFAAGHSIQLQIQSSDFPNYLVHPGTDENPWFATSRRATQQCLTLGGANAANLTLPIVEAG